MAYPRRDFRSDLSYHGMVRGVGRRSLFDGDEDARHFLSLVARAAHRNGLEVDAYCLMPNHVHLLIRSPSGALSDAMRDIESIYARGFNRRRDRPGHLVQARFKAKAVASMRYFEALVNYIDQNPVDAGIVERAIDYPHGSARLYARAAGPLWLHRDRVEDFVRRQTGDLVYTPAAYARVFDVPRSPGARRWFKEAMASSAPADSSLDDLLAASPTHILDWMDERALAADGTRREVPLADTRSVTKSIRVARRASPGREIRLRRKVRPMWTLLEAGLLRDLTHLSYVQIGVRLCVPAATVIGFCGEHRTAMREHPDYRDAAVACVESAINACHPTRISRARL